MGRVKVARKMTDGRAAVTVDNKLVGYVRRFEHQKVRVDPILKDHHFAHTEATWVVTWQFFDLKDAAGPKYDLLKQLIDAKPWASGSSPGGTDGDDVR